MKRKKQPAQKAAPAPHPPEPGPAKIWSPSLAAALGVVWFLLNKGYTVMWPTNVAWLLRAKDDWTQHYLGWAYFRQAPLSWPLGRVPDLGAPVGTSIAMTDANPLLCLLFRPFATFLPHDFQFAGAFMAACFALQGYVAAWLFGRLGLNRKHAVLGALFAVLSPVFLWTTRSEVLIAHWTLLAGMALLLVDWRGAPVRRLQFGAVLLVLIAEGLNPYLLAMVLPLVVAAVWRWAIYDRAITKSAALTTSVCIGLLVPAVAYALGYFGQSTLHTRGGFGEYSTDLIALVNSRGWSFLAPSQPEHHGQYEGFAWLGLGGVFLVALAITQRLRGKPSGSMGRPGAWLLPAVAVFLYIFALSDKVSLRGSVVMDLRPYTEALLPLLSTLRSSGRFVWVPMYALIVWGVVTVATHLSQKVVTRTFACLLVLQVLDMAVHDVLQPHFTQPAGWSLDHEAWRVLGHDYKKLALYPPVFTDSGIDCAHASYPSRFELPYGMLAYEHGMSVNSAFVGYSDADALQGHCDRTLDAARQGVFAADTVYIIKDGHMSAFFDHADAVVCGYVDGRNVCVRQDRSTPLRDQLRASAVAMGS